MRRQEDISEGKRLAADAVWPNLSFFDFRKTGQKRENLRDIMKLPAEQMMDAVTLREMFAKNF